MKAADLNLVELLSFAPEQGLVRLDADRMLLLRAEALGALRQQLIDTLGEDIARGILFRFGFESGHADSAHLGQRFEWDNDLEWLASGPVMHMWEGVTQVETHEIDFDRETGRFLMRGLWRNSYEAEQHLSRYGRSEVPVCWTLTGYASGWCTAFMGRRIIARETACVAQGHPACAFSIEPVEALGEEGARWQALLEPDRPVRRMEERMQAAQSELRQRNDELMRVNEELLALYRSRTEFVAEVSHELRTPLNLILAPLEELLGLPDEALGPEARERLEVTHRNALRLLRLVNSVLDLTRLTAGGALRLEAVDLGAFIQDLVGTFRQGFEARRLNLTVEAEPGLPPLTADPEALEKVAGNLLGNAMKYTPVGGAVEVRVQRRDGTQILEVRDSGPGIPPDLLPRIFEPYQQGDPTRDGYGLGLALVREQVKLLGGTVEVESAPETGTLFRVRVPEIEGPAAHAPTLRPGSDLHSVVVDDAAPPLPVHGPPARSGSRILVVEDNRELAQYLEGLLSREWLVELAADGVEALERVEASPPDLVLSDVMMPRMDGLTLVARLKAAPETRHIPVILVTARGELEHRLRGFSSGADDYVLKPFASRELLARVRTQLALHEAQGELRAYAAGLEKLVEEQVGHILAQNARLERANRELEEFLAIASHDLKSPLISISGFTDLVAESLGEKPDPAVKVALERIRFNAAWMRQLIDRLLSLAEVRAGPARPAEVDLDMLMHQLSLRLRPNIEAVGGRLFVAGALGHPFADVTRLEEALANLLENAVKYREPRRTLEVRVESRTREGWLEVTVSDNGLGIPEAHREKVFQPLYRIGGGLGQGSGLGLYIVRRVAEEAGGSVWVDGDEGEGTTAHLLLPLAPLGDDRAA